MTHNKLAEGDIIALDIGERRIGVARIHSVVRLAEPLPPIVTSDQDASQAIAELCKHHNAVALVGGLPRGLDGQETAQTQAAREFMQELRTVVDLPLYMIDEAGTSKEAEKRMEDMKATSKDSVAAMIMAEDFVQHADKEALRI